MKRCEVCNKLADNGDKRCRHCGSPFEYDPKVTPFSETKIFLVLLTVVLIAFVVSKSLPLQPPDPSVCSRTSYTRFKKIVVQTHKDALNILAENYISSKMLSELMVYRKNAESLPVPACLEPAKVEYVEYAKSLYYTAVLSAWGGYGSATLWAESAANHLDNLNAHLEIVRECLPDCP